MSQGPKVISEIIHPELEPGVINHEMIRQAIEDNYHKGEAGRLERLEEVEYNSVEVLRLDFQSKLKYFLELYFGLILWVRFTFRYPTHRSSLGIAKFDQAFIKF